MSYVTKSLIETDIGADVVARLARRGSTPQIELWIRSVTARLESVLQVAGYTGSVPATVYAADASDCPPAITDLALRMWKRLALERGVDLPADEQIEVALRDIQDGVTEIPGLPRSVSRAPGGVLGSDMDPNSTNTDDPRYRPRTFSRQSWRGW